MAEDGASALEVASSGERIDILVSDIVMPGGMSGIEIYHRISDQRPGLKCLFMTGYGASLDHQLPEGTELLLKPIPMNDFATKMRQMLDA